MASFRGFAAISCLFLSFALAYASIIHQWEQCGGKGGNCNMNDFTCVDAAYPNFSCVSGYSCARQSEWYWQCVFGNSGPTVPATPGNTSDNTNSNSGATPPSQNTIGKYGQCGGKGGSCGNFGGSSNCVDAEFSGYSCARGSTCNRQSEWYWQCM